ncbi:hypothetical protein OIU84_011833 [Salix udensis]|uniref:Uncharacterized protein n=1 Tax=Salix udensis TaxID=889485 RepID=A0AAD6NXL9_9ROSI|nr:hypothetical protein OIU84_011833 [Salix udensis]
MEAGPLYVHLLFSCPPRFPPLYARFPMQLSEKPRVSNQVKIDQLSEANADLEYGAASSPLSLPPLESLPPLSLPGSAPPFCINPPFGPPSPSTTLPSPVGHTPPASPPPFAPVLPIQNPPPSPPHSFASPPTPKSPPYVPSPPKCIPSPSGYLAADGLPTTHRAATAA